MKKPNIILIICDQLRADCINADGNTLIETPLINNMAATGSMFSHAYSAVPSCIPARATLMSGQDQWHTGVLGMGWGQGQMPNDFSHSLAGEFTNAGYRTHMIGKGHFFPQRTLMGFQSTEIEEAGRTLPKGFKDEYRAWFDENAPKGVTPDDHGIDWNAWQARPWHTEERFHPTAWTIMRSVEFLKRRDQDEPFFLNISFDRPHSPYTPPKDYWDMYIDDETPPAVIGEWASVHDVGFEERDDVNAWHGKMTEKQIHRARAGYYGDVTFIDAQLGVLFNWMRRFDHDAYKNTWVIFTSDHGDMLGDHNLWRKTYAYEASARIPFIVVPPVKTRKSVKNRRVDEIVELRDIMPTLLDAAGLDIPKTVDGKSVLPLLYSDAGSVEWRSYIHGEHCVCYAELQDMHYVTDGKRKFIWLPRVGTEQFFDLESDPGEVNNLIEDSKRKEEIKKWRNYLIAELEKRDCGWVVDGKLHCIEGEPLVSPYKEKRWQGL